MPLRTLTLGLLWLSLAALVALLPLLWRLRDAGGGIVDAALLINVLLLPLPPLCAIALRRSADAAAARRAATEGRMRFLAQINHEIRTPMNAIMGMTQLALQTPLSAEQRDLLTKADAASRALLTLVNDVLDVSRIEAGQLQIESVPLRLEDVVSQVMELVRTLHANPAVELICDWADASLLGARGQLRGDALRLQQVLVNLMSNALKFTPAGHVTLRLAALPSEDDGHVPLCITVQDSGVGMSAEQITGLFQDFQQEGAPMPRRYGGTGLGLAITRQLIGLMGGTLDVQSQPGRGSSFEIRLPLPLDADGTPATPIKPQRVLLAKGDAQAREATFALLQVLGAGDGLAATSDAAQTLAALADARRQGQGFDWLLLDWRLPGPGNTGAELLAQLRREQPALRIAVLIPPGSDEIPAQAQARAFGARAICLMPPLPGELRRLLGNAPEERPAGARGQSLDGMRVLLVEDHPINQEIALRLLASRGARVELAGNGQEGLEKLQAAGPDGFDLVLMDLQMPVLDGLSATRRLRELPGFGGLPVLAMTAHALAEERAQCLAAGMQGHIAKPLDVARLVRELQRYKPRAEPAPSAVRPALELDAGLRQFDGQAALYRRTMQGFSDQYAPGLAPWADWLARGEWAELRRAAHTLQGLAATLGAQFLHQQALALERSAASADTGGASIHLDRVEAALAALLAEIRGLLESGWGSTEPAPLAGPGDLGELHELLAQSDSRALDWWQAHGAYSGLGADRQRRVGEALAVMDFDAAAAALKGAD